MKEKLFREGALRCEGGIHCELAAVLLMKEDAIRESKAGDNLGPIQLRATILTVDQA